MRIKGLGQIVFGIFLAFATSAVHARDEKKTEEIPECIAWVLVTLTPGPDHPPSSGALKCWMGSAFSCSMSFGAPFQTRAECLPFEDGIFKFCMRSTSCTEGAYVQEGRALAPARAQNPSFVRALTAKDSFL